MTFEELHETPSMEYSNENKFINIGRITAEIIWQSLEKRKLWCGGYELAKLMKSNPENCMFCILPEVQHSDVTGCIEHTLIEAICWENNIKILKVNDREKLTKLLSGRNYSKNMNENFETVSCVLLEFPEDCLSAEEKLANEFYKWIMQTHQYSSYVIQLPV